MSYSWYNSSVHWLTQSYHSMSFKQINMSARHVLLCVEWEYIPQLKFLPLLAGLPEVHTVNPSPWQSLSFLQCPQHVTPETDRQVNPYTAGNAWVCTQHCGYWCPGAKAPSHQYPHCWLNIHCIGPVSYRNIIVIGNYQKIKIHFEKINKMF